MTVTMSDVRALLDPDEPNYDTAVELGPEALPVLEQLVRGDDPMLAAKAAYLASLIPGDQRLAVLDAAATSVEPTVRIAAAAGLRNLSAADADDLADNLLGDADFGVRKRALQSATVFRAPAMTERLRRVAETSPDEILREMAADSLRER